MLITFLVAALAGMGVGSGGLYVLYLTVFAGVPQLRAQGLNLYFFIFATAAALLLHARAHPLALRRLLYVCFVGSIGCGGGAWLARQLGGTHLRTIFACLLILTGAVTLFSRNAEKKKKFEKTIYK